MNFYMLKSPVMASLPEKRHTLAHLLAAAVAERYPHAKATIGPAVDNGFYYDFDFSGGEKPGEDELAKLTEDMRGILESWDAMSGVEVSAIDAKDRFKDNPYKLELIEEIAGKGEKITLYTAGGFTDLCRGGHSEHPNKDIAADSFVLDRTAGAYWRGDENNTQLTRIYGLAFDTKADLEAYKVQLEEARKRDHRKIAREQGLLVFSDLVGSGMPLFTPKGNVIRSEIIRFSRELNDELGFGEVHTPNVNKGELFKISGHYDKYKEDMLSVSSQYVKDEMFLKPMNCPQHTQIYAGEPHSYRDLPIRFSDFAVLYRDERPGELSGLTRLRAFSQDDGHIFCREDQIEEELLKVLDVVKRALAVYDIGYWIRLSLRDPEKKEKYLGSDEDWERSEAELKAILDKSGVEYRPALGEAAFYGPKLDIMAVDAIGREWQISTIQVDRTQPARFELEYTADDGSKKRPVMIHRALIGSPDRFMGILTEHYAGAFPLWLAPIQVAVLPVGEKHAAYASEVMAKLKASGMRAELHADDSLGKRIRSVKTAKVPAFIVIGDAEADAGTVTVENNRNGDKQTVPLADFISGALARIKERANI